MAVGHGVPPDGAAQPRLLYRCAVEPNLELARGYRQDGRSNTVYPADFYFSADGGEVLIGDHHSLVWTVRGGQILTNPPHQWSAWLGDRGYVLSGNQLHEYAVDSSSWNTRLSSLLPALASDESYEAPFFYNFANGQFGQF